MFNRKKKSIAILKDSFTVIKNESFDFNLIERYFRNKDNSGSFQVISDKTCNDLDFDEFFMFADRTTSKPGQQFLYDRLRNIPSDRDKFISQESLLRTLKGNMSLVYELQYLLKKLSGTNAYYIQSLFQEKHADPPSWFYLVKLLSFTSLLSVLTLPYIPQAGFILIFVFIINLGIHWWNKRNYYSYAASIPQVLIMNDVAKKIMKYDFPGLNTNDIVSGCKSLNSVRNRMSFFRLEAKVESDTQIAAWFMLEIIKIAFLLEPLFLFSVLRRLDKRRMEIHAVFSFIGYLDSLISALSLRESLKSYSVPEITIDLKCFSATNMYHPLIPDCVTNSISADRSLLLTGSNMSGKTTFIRTIGLNTISALSINTCFAEEFRLPVFRLYTAIRIKDDLMDDKSYFFEEVLNVKNMLDQHDTGVLNLFLLDEIFKGTNTIERVSAGKAVLSALSRNNLVLVSTHDVELVDLLRDEYSFYYFSEKIDGTSIEFDYKLKAGTLQNRNAIRILEMNDYPLTVINEALQIAGQMDKKGKAKG